MLSLILGDLANLAHEERLRVALSRAEFARVCDGGPASGRIRLSRRGLFGARVMRAGAWIGGIDLEWSADHPQPQSPHASAL